MNCIIVEDDELAAVALKKCIERTEGVAILAVFKSAEEAFEFLKENTCDLIFLDIEMEKMSGLDLIKKLIQVPHVVIVSTKADYAAEAYNYDVVDYIVKPINYGRFLQSISKVNKVSENIQTPGPDYFYVKQDSRLVQLFYKDVIYVEALADYVTIHAGEKKYTILSTMKAIENQLPSNEFMRVHRSYIVRLDKVKTIEENTVSIEGKLIPISRSNRVDFDNRVKLL